MSLSWLSDLTVKMVMIIIMIHLLLLSILYFGLGAVVEDGYQSQFVDHVRVDAGNFAANLSDSDELAKNLNRQAIKDTVLTGNALYVEVFDKEGNLIESIGGLDKKSEFREDFYFGQGEDDVYHIASTIYDSSGRYMGEFQIGYDEMATSEQIDLAYNRALMFSIIYVAIAFVFSIFFK